MTLTIIGVKIVGICSNHRNPTDEIPRKKDGSIWEDEHIACICCIFKPKGRES